MNEFVVALLSLFVTSISVAVSIPGSKEDDLRVMVLVFMVFFLGKLLSSLSSFEKEVIMIKRILLVVESALDILTISLCIHYVFLAMNSNADAAGNFIGNFIGRDFYFWSIVITSATHILGDILRCEIALLKNFRTNNRILMINR